MLEELTEEELTEARRHLHDGGGGARWGVGPRRAELAD